MNESLKRHMHPIMGAYFDELVPGLLAVLLLVIKQLHSILLVEVDHVSLYYSD